MITSFMNGGMMGLAISAVVGPVAILCLKKACTIGFKSGVAIGIGASIANMLFGFVAFWGLGAVSSLLLEHADLLRIFGGIFLIYLGYKSFQLKDIECVDTQTVNNTTYVHDAMIAFVLTLTSPITILVFLSFCSAFGITSLSLHEALLATVGVGLGSFAWWVLLTLFGIFIRKKMGTSVIKTINMVSGIVIIIFGIVSVAYGLKKFW